MSDSNALDIHPLTGSLIPITAVLASLDDRGQFTVTIGAEATQPSTSFMTLITSPRRVIEDTLLSIKLDGTAGMQIPRAMDTMSVPVTFTSSQKARTLMGILAPEGSLVLVYVSKNGFEKLTIRA